MSRIHADTILERIDLLAHRFGDLDRLWFYARITQVLKKRCRDEERNQGVVHLDDWKKLLADAHRDTKLHARSRSLAPKLR